jgi:hypothetical protein
MHDCMIDCSGCQLKLILSMAVPIEENKDEWY